MKVSEILATSTKAYPSLEIVPPLRGMTKNELLESIAPFMEFNPKYINVTSHRDEHEYREEADGTFSRHLVRNRISETTVCAAIMSRYDVEVVPHLICGGSTSEEIESKLDNLEFLGINNIVALRGDCITGEKRFTPTPGGYRYASELVEGIRKYQGSASYRRSRKSEDDRYFCIGVGAYPEKHFEAPNIETDIANLKKKVDAGAEHLISQLFFDNNLFYDFVEKARIAGINVPIEAGIMPVVNKKQIERMVSLCGASLPAKFTKMMSRYEHKPEAMRDAGIAYAVNQIVDLVSQGVDGIHLYTMNNPYIARRISESVKSLF